MSGVKHTPVSGVHPDNTALRAVDACGGTYTSAEEASGWAGGHRAALAQATVAVGHADAITAHLLEALAEARLTLSLTRTNIMVEMRKSEGAAYRWDAVPELLANRIAQCDAAIARARGERDGGGE